MERFPTLYSQRLILRKLTIDDVPALIKHANNKKISDRIINLPHPYEEPNAVFRISYVVQGFKNKSRYVFSICSKEKNELMGEISLHLLNTEKSELGYWLGESFWGQGFTSEAIASICEFGFSQLGLKVIFATSNADNLASHRVLEKNGFLKKGINGNVILFELMH